MLQICRGRTSSTAAGRAASGAPLQRARAGRACQRDGAHADGTGMLHTSLPSFSLRASRLRNLPGPGHCALNSSSVCCTARSRASTDATVVAGTEPPPGVRPEAYAAIATRCALSTARVSKVVVPKHLRRHAIDATRRCGRVCLKCWQPVYVCRDAKQSRGTIVDVRATTPLRAQHAREQARDALRTHPKKRVAVVNSPTIGHSWHEREPL